MDQPGRTEFIAHELASILTQIANRCDAMARGAGDDHLNVNAKVCANAAREGWEICEFILEQRQQSSSNESASDIYEVIHEAALEVGVVPSIGVPRGTMVMLDRIAFKRVCVNLLRNAANACGGDGSLIAVRCQNNSGATVIQIEDRSACSADRATWHIDDERYVVDHRDLATSIRRSGKNALRRITNTIDRSVIERGRSSIKPWSSTEQAESMRPIQQNETTNTIPRSKRSNGIGLHFCRFAVASMGGSLSVTPISGIGTIATVTIPYKQRTVAA